MLFCGFGSCIIQLTSDSKEIGIPDFTGFDNSFGFVLPAGSLWIRGKGEKSEDPEVPKFKYPMSWVCKDCYKFDPRVKKGFQSPVKQTIPSNLETILRNQFLTKCRFLNFFWKNTTRILFKSFSRGHPPISNLGGI